MNPTIIDLSADNGSAIDFNALFAAGITNVILRSSLGFGDVDKNLQVNAKAAAVAGITVSYYHLAYTHPNVDVVSDATKQSQFFCDTVNSTGIPAKYVALDLETPTTLSSDDYALWVSTFLSNVQSIMGIPPIVYSYKAWLDAHLPASHSLGSYSLWIANYNNVTTPDLPIGWSTYFLWQYSETGSVSGVTGNVDCSQFNPSSI